MVIAKGDPGISAQKEFRGVFSVLRPILARSAERAFVLFAPKKDRHGRNFWHVGIEKTPTQRIEVMTQPRSGASPERKQVVSEISQDVQSAVDTIDSELEQAGRIRADGDEPRVRACMMCGTKFESEGWHNRLCGSCRKKSAPLG